MHIRSKIFFHNYENNTAWIYNHCVNLFNIMNECFAFINIRRQCKIILKTLLLAIKYSWFSAAFFVTSIFILSYRKLKVTFNESNLHNWFYTALWIFLLEVFFFSCKDI